MSLNLLLELLRQKQGRRLLDADDRSRIAPVDSMVGDPDWERQRVARQMDADRRIMESERRNWAFRREGLLRSRGLDRNYRPLAEE